MFKIRKNPDKAQVRLIQEALKENDGYCPCQIKRTERTKCMCLNFIEGEEKWCHCGLYYKVDE